MAYEKQKKMAYNFITLFSSERKGNEFQRVKIGYHDEKITFNFYKGVTGGNSNNSMDTFVKVDYMVIATISSLVDQIVRRRVEEFRKGEEYSDNLFVEYSINFTEKDTNQIRNIGKIIFKNMITTDNKNIVALVYTNGTDEWTIGLGTQYLPKQLSATPDLLKDIDLNDANLYALAYMLNNVVKNYSIFAQQDKFIGTLLYKINAMCEKLGVSQGNGDGGKYNSNNYRSNNNSNREISNNNSSLDTDTDTDDIPF